MTMNVNQVTSVYAFEEITEAIDLRNWVGDSQAECCIHRIIAVNIDAVDYVSFGCAHPACQDCHVKPETYQPLALLINNPLYSADMGQKRVGDYA